MESEASVERPIRVAIIGGGCASLAAAWELSRPERGGRFAITVYQAGWRLGGKGASGRGLGGRIEEHGLHLWMGFYENAFRLMRQCYAEAGRDPARCPVATFAQAFTPAPVVGVVDRMPNGTWQPWIAHFPPGRGEPGDDAAGRVPFSVRGYLSQAASLLGELLRSAQAAQGEVPRPPPHPLDPSRFGDLVGELLKYGQLAGTAALFEAFNLVRAGVELFVPSPQAGRLLSQLVDAVAVVVRRQLDALVAGDGEVRRVWQVIDLILAILRGSIRFGLALDPRGFDAINDYDWRDWLRLNGAAEQSLDSGFVRGIYDLVFAFADGDVTRPSLAAGVALRGAMRMFFTYRGALFWRMNAGMGDVVFAPLYEVLSRRGVRFEFFHRLRNVGLSDDGGSVAHLTFDEQARVLDGGYRPLVDVGGVPSWPARPDYAQLEGGERLEREGWAFESPWDQRRRGEKQLLVGKDFDFVVLGIGVAAIPEVAPSLLARSEKWRALVERVKTVPTQAVQLWLDREMRDLGWPHPPTNLSGYVEPFDTWADMSHLAPREAWAEPPKSIAYFCSVLPDVAPPGAVDEAFARREHARVREHARTFLERDLAALWPAVRDRAGRFRWDVLHAEGDGARATGAARLDTQFWTANVHPSDRYSLSLPGSVAYRLSPLDRTFDNLTVAGDWTQSGLDSGCVESAVMSGMLAAHALSGTPHLHDIVGYDHP